MILADERFAYGGVRNQLSVWLRPAVQPFDTFGKAAAKLSQFFRHCVATLPPPKEKPKLQFGVLGEGGGGGGVEEAERGGARRGRGRGRGRGLRGRCPLNSLSRRSFVWMSTPPRPRIPAPSPPRRRRRWRQQGGGLAAMLAAARRRGRQRRQTT